MKEIREACKMACIDDYIMSLPDQYDTMIGENGVILSGGQRQRLAIARALLLKTEIILLDEATSALDNETQSEIQNAIDNLKGEYTILIVAHRLSTVKDCDRIFVVDEGKIIASGTHRSLLKKCDFYKNLYATANINGGYVSEEYNNWFYNDNFIIGGGLTLGMKTKAGPIEISLMGSNKSSNLFGFLNIGYWF